MLPTQAFRGVLEKKEVVREGSIVLDVEKVGC